MGKWGGKSEIEWLKKCKENTENKKERTIKRKKEKKEERTGKIGSKRISGTYLNIPLNLLMLHVDHLNAFGPDGCTSCMMNPFLQAPESCPTPILWFKEKIRFTLFTDHGYVLRTRLGFKLNRLRFTGHQLLESWRTVRQTISLFLRTNQDSSV